MAAPQDGLRIEGSGTQPALGFACCEQGLDEARALFADDRVMGQLEALHASVAVPTLDFSAERAGIVRRLNQAGIAAVAWILLPKEQGYYLNADNASQAASRFAEFEDWTRQYDLHWTAVGLDVEPRFSELASLKGHWWRALTTLVRHDLDRERAVRAREEYATLIQRVQSSGYPVQTYQMPFIVDERMENSSLLDRLLGTVDVRGNIEYLMLYTSFAPSIGTGMIAVLGPHAQAIVVGVTDEGPGGLNWAEFSRDLIVASHFTRNVGVYDVEGCVRQGFLPRLVTMDWSQSIVVPAASIRRARWLGEGLRLALWLGDRLAWIGAGALLVLLLAIAVWRGRKRGLGASSQAGDSTGLTR